MPDMDTIAFAIGSGLYVIGGLALVAICLLIDHVLFRRRVRDAIEHPAPVPARRAIFDFDLDAIDWRFPR